jgi:hypothetical protein
MTAPDTDRATTSDVRSVATDASTTAGGFERELHWNAASDDLGRRP